MDEKEREKITELEHKLLDIKLFMLVLTDAIHGNEENAHFEPFIELILDKIDALSDDLCFFSLPPERLSEQNKPTETD